MSDKRNYQEEWFKLIRAQEVENVKLFLSELPSKADFSINQTSAGRTALHILCQQETEANIELMKVLLDHPGIDVNCYTKTLHYTPLHMTCKAGFLHLTALLLTHPTIALYVYTLGLKRTPLDLAKSRNHYAVIQLLQPFLLPDDINKLGSGNNDGNTTWEEDEEEPDEVDDTPEILPDDPKHE